MAISAGTGAVLAAGISGGLNFVGASSANEANEDIARANRIFQRKMSNTSYRRAVRDLRAAGLNPILAYSQGGASTPGGFGYTAINELAGADQAVNTALAARRQKTELELMRSQERKEGALEGQAHSQTNLNRQNEVLVGERINQARAEAESARAHADLAKLESSYSVQQMLSKAGRSAWTAGWYGRQFAPAVSTATQAIMPPFLKRIPQAKGSLKIK